MSNLKNKIIVVTGGNGLLGKSLVSYLEKKEAVAISADINPSKSPNDFLLDISDEKSVETMISELIKKYRVIHGWVNNAYPRTHDWGNKLENISSVSWRKNVDMHLNGYFLCCQKILEQMKVQREGVLINMSSVYGMVGPDFSIYEGTDMTMPAAYAAIKGGIINFSKYLASYYGSYNIRVNCVSPGGIFDDQPEDFVRKYESKVPLRRMANTGDIVPSIAFLLSDEASYITGHNLVIDGGWTSV